MQDTARAAFRAWIRDAVTPDGTIADRVDRCPATWADLARAGVCVLAPPDAAWLRTWTLRWIREDGSLAIPTPHEALTGAYPPPVVFGPREPRRGDR
jgi:hypothetical protein